MLDKKIGVGISVLKKSIWFSDAVRCWPLRIFQIHSHLGSGVYV